MNSKEQFPLPEDSFEVGLDETSSVDDFIRELEAKEKDLHITADMQIEVAEADAENPLQQALEQETLSGEPQRSAGGAGLKTRVFELEHEVEELQNRLRDLKSERNDIQEKSDRRLKDFESYKYRMDRERRGSFIDQIATLTSQMLPVLDNLDRALGSTSALDRPKSAEFQQFYDGIVLVNQHVLDVFGNLGVQSIISVGQSFDPNFHEAVAAEERQDLPANTVTEEMLRGYRIGNRVIRHSMVKVSTRPVPSRFDPSPSEAAEENSAVAADDLVAEQ